MSRSELYAKLDQVGVSFNAEPKDVLSELVNPAACQIDLNAVDADVSLCSLAGLCASYVA